MAAHHIQQSLTHYIQCDFVEEFANDGIKLCRIELDGKRLLQIKAVDPPQLGWRHQHVKQGHVRIRQHLDLTVFEHVVVVVVIKETAKTRQSRVFQAQQRHLQAVRDKGLERCSLRSSVRCLLTLIQVCEPEFCYSLTSLLVDQIAPAAMLWFYYILHPASVNGEHIGKLFAEERAEVLDGQVGCRVMSYLNADCMRSLAPFMWYLPFLHKFETFSV